MTVTYKAAAGAFEPVRIGHAMAGTLLTAVLAVVFGLSVMIEVSNTPDVAPRADKPVMAIQAASEPAAPVF